MHGEQEIDFVRVSWSFQHDTLTYTVPVLTASQIYIVQKCQILHNSVGESAGKTFRCRSKSTCKHENNEVQIGEASGPKITQLVSAIASHLQQLMVNTKKLAVRQQSSAVIKNCRNAEKVKKVLSLQVSNKIEGHFCKIAASFSLNKNGWRT